jgi:AraC-like DNA-binding protein
MLEDNRDQSKFWIAKDLGGLQLLRASYTRQAFPRHFHDTYVIRIQERGIEQFDYRGSSHISPAGSIVIIHPYEIRTGRGATDETWAYRALYPTISLLDEIASGIGLEAAPYFATPVIFDAQLAEAMLDLHHTLEASSESLERQGLFVSTLSMLIERHSGKSVTLGTIGSETRAVKMAREYIEAHYAENPSLDELANLVGLDRFYFLRAFRKQIGLPPHEFLNQLRIESAKRLLSRGWPIADAALEAGFVDQSHLSNRFKRYVGLTPKQFAQHII